MAKMSSKKEDERNEKIIRGLLKLPPNRRCINCNSLGPQYVCTNFWTFVCIICSGIHREFTHRVKSVSMSKFTTQEVEALQKGGNQRARELFLIDWDTERMRLPCNSNPDKIRDFIKNVYVEKKYAGGRSCDKPPRDTQTHKGTEDHRRASSYHSFSQSPPYDYQYEERRYGRQAGMLSRKPGSDRGQYEGKISSFIYSPDCQAEQICEDRLANNSSGSRMSDYSVSTTGDPFRSDGQSLKFSDSGYSSPYTQVRDSLAEDGGPQKLSASMESNVKENQNRIPSVHRCASAGSFGSINSNSVSLKSADSGSLLDSVFEPEHASESHQAETSAFALSDMSSAAHTPSIDLFSQAYVQPQIASSASSIDLFADFTQQPSVLPASERILPAASFRRNDGWAAFDLPQHTLQPSEAKSLHSHSPFEANQGLPPMTSVVKDIIKGNIDLYSSVHNSNWFPVQNSSTYGHSSVLDNQWSMDFSDLKGSADTSNLQEGSSQERKSTNPFDLPYDLSSAANNVFLDMSSLQAALPDTQVPATFLSEFPEPWFPQNSPASFIPSVPQGGLSYIGGQVPSTQMQMQNIPSQGPVASVGGNPFA